MMGLLDNAKNLLSRPWRHGPASAARPCTSLEATVPAAESDERDEIDRSRDNHVTAPLTIEPELLVVSLKSKDVLKLDKAGDASPVDRSRLAERVRRGTSHIRSNSTDNERT